MKLSYTQMQEWIRTMVLMVRAWVLSPERDSPYLWFCCRRRMELLTKTLSFAIPFWWQVSFWSFSPPIPLIPYVGFFVLYSCSYAPWFPYRVVVILWARLGFRLWGLMSSPTLSRVSSGWKFWPGNIVRPSVIRRTSPFAHWCWVWFLQLPHQCVHLLYSSTAFPKWEGSWHQLACRGRQNQREWRSSKFLPEHSPQFPRGNGPISPLAAST